MYSVAVRDHVMVAHSLRGAAFGPAQRLHGATYVIDLELHAEHLDADGVVVNIGKATAALRATLAPLDYQNLDQLDRFRDRNSTTEALARLVFDDVADRVTAGELGPSDHLVSMKVTLRESHIAWASYQGDLPASPRAGADTGAGAAAAPSRS